MLLIQGTHRFVASPVTVQDGIRSHRDGMRWIHKHRTDLAQRGIKRVWISQDRGQ